ncbi:uncharacterized protein BX664DRAFT_288171 [Halteromyces radiatus]|uniref:uncharacterized protein n=1 Tax=Halteromyces radiatus TaxID=101107 RepID=UPI002220A58F|nr:uncharacterized protein BX664DRAFT_288171 [Halteromyces radiatus]KAI8098597.1 hypothetical protein BX664DRAFT_288171 [Halteromyces radiatus]
MSILSQFETSLKDLNKYTPQQKASEGSSNNGTALDVKSLANGIATTVLTDIPESDYDYVYSLLFHREQGVLNFLRANVSTSDPSIRIGQVIILELILSIIHKGQSVIQPYIKLLEQYCITLTRTGSVKVRCAALEVLTGLVKSATSLDTSVLDSKGLYEKFSYELRLPTTTVPNSVKGSILTLLGTIVQYCPDKVDSLEASLLARNCINMVSNELYQKQNSDNAIIVGGLNGLTALLLCERYDANTLSIDIKTIYSMLKTVLAIPDDLARYAVPIAGLNLFTEHMSLFGSFIVNDYAEIYTLLQKLCELKNRDVSKMAFRALESFFKQLGTTVAQKHDTEETAVFKFFMGKFINYLQQENAELDFQQFSISVRGIGYFAKASKQQLQPDQVTTLQDLLIKRGTWICSEANTNQELLTTHLPSFIQAYTQFIRYYDDIQPVLLSVLHRMADAFVLNYYRLSAYTRQPGIFAIESVIRTLYSKGEGMLRHFLSNFFYNALIYTCNSSNFYTNTIIDDDRPVYKEMLYFWKSILNNEYSHKGQMKDIGKQIHSAVYDEFLSAIFRMIRVLNLNVEKVEDDMADDTLTTVSNQQQQQQQDQSSIDYIHTISMNLAPVNQKDFILYQNLVEFWCTLLPQLDNQRMQEWIQIAGASLIQSSLQKPLVSGFYRMLATILTITNELGLFHDILKSRENRHQKQIMKTPLLEVYEIFYDYVHQVWHRMKQFKDELLVSCLRLILASPLDFFDIHELVLPLQAALRFGLTYYPMATLALKTLEILVDVDSPTHTAIQSHPTFFQSVLPLFNEYLMMDLGSKYNSKSDAQVLEKMKHRMATAASRKRGMIHDHLTNDQLGAVEDEDADIGLREIQLDMMRFLGRLGGANKYILHSANGDSTLEDDNQSEAISHKERNRLVAWDPERQLAIHVPFPNAGIELSIEELLPRICELAESSPNRKVKVVSCEFLHGLVLVMIGNSAFQARDRKGAVASRYHKTYERVFPVLIRLAIDLDQVTRDMFRALVAQLIHWLTNNAQYENPETMILLQTCLEAACGTNAALRDYGATCLYEFVKWSIKQTSAQATQSPMNMKSLLKRLYHLTTHPSTSKRLGASMIFNRIYRLFREEQPLVDEFTLELLYHFLFSLRLAENDHPSTGTQQQTKESISHIKRILRVKSNLFMSESPIRRSFPGIEHADIPSLVEWCFQQTGKSQREYAKACMDIFSEFVLVLPDSKNGRGWLMKRISNNNNYLMEIYSPPSPLSSFLSRDKSSEGMFNEGWLNGLASSLDGYIWLLERDILTPSMCFILQKNENDFSLSDACSSCFQLKGGNDKLTLNGMLRINALRTYDLYRTVCLLVRLLENTNSNDSSDLDKKVQMVENTGLVTLPEFSKWLACMLLLPHQLVDTIQSGQISFSTWVTVSGVRSVAVRFLDLVQKYLPDSILQHCCSALGGLMSSENINSLTLDSHQASLRDTMEMLQGIKQLQGMGLLDLTCKKWNEIDRASGPTSSDAFCQSLFDKFLDYQQMDDPTLVDLLGNMVQIAFNQPYFVKYHALELLGCADDSNRKSDKELLTIYNRHSSTINNCISMNFLSFAPYIVKHLHSQYIKQTIIGLFDYLKLDKNRHAMENKQLTKDLLSDPTFLTEIYRQWSNLENYTSLVQVMKGIFGANPAILLQARQSTSVYETLITIMEHLLDGSYSLSVKSEAFDLLPFFLQLDDPYATRISKQIRTIVNSQMPICFSGMTPGSASYSEAILALDKLLTIMSTFHSVVIFNALVPTFMQDNGQLYDDMIAPKISDFAHGLELSSFKEVSQTCFDYFKDKNLYSEHRMKAIDLVISILMLVPWDHVIAFYETNIIYIMETLKQEELRRGSDDEIIMDLREKTCCFKLLEVLYELLPVRLVHSPQSKISTIWEQSENKPSQGRKMTIDLVSQAHQAKSKKHLSENESLAKTRLEYQQAAYNSAASSILRTQKSEKFFVGFLFQEKPSEPLWENLLDPTATLALTVELKQPLMKTRIKEFRTKFGQKNVNNSDSSSNVGYMASVNLAGSSVSQASLSELALESLGRTKPITQETTTIDQAEMEELEAEEGETTRDASELELDIFNSNPCMKLLTAVINRLHTSITPPDENVTQMPLWMLEINRAFTAENASLMQRLFLAKLIINCPDVFEPYAKFWIRPLIELAIRGDEYGQPLNYFVQGLCVIIVIWGKMVLFNDTQDDRYLLFKFVRYLCRYSYHENNGVLRNNIQVLKGVFENWKKWIIVPTRAIYQELSSSTDKKSKRNQVGLQIAGIVLANGLDLYHSGPEVDLDGLTETEFYNALLANFTNHYTEVRAATAEVAAWALTTMKKQGRKDTIAIDLKDYFLRMVSKLDPTSTNMSDPSPFVTVLYRLHLHDDDLCRPSIPKVYYLLPQLKDKALVYALEVIKGCVDETAGDVFHELQAKGLLKIINLRDDATQIAILKLLYKISAKLTSDQAVYILNDLVMAFGNHSNRECRDYYYKILQTFYDKLSGTTQLKDQLKIQLLRGLIDNDDYIRSSMGLYLQNKTNMTNDIYERAKIILKELYSPEVEDIYINYAIQMLLQTTIDSYEYDKPIFENPLPNAHFDDHIQDLNTSWRRNMSMTPLFVASQDQISQSTHRLENQLRQTQQTLEFSQTQAGGGASLMSMYGGSSISPSITPSIDTGVTQSLGPTSQRDDDNRKRQQQYAKLRRRYVRSTPESTSSFFIRRQERLKKDLQKYMFLQKQMREKKVTMYRQYRVGELPDIQIKYRELIEPLQALGRYDLGIARLLYSQLIVAIGTNAERNASKENYKSDMVAVVADHLASSKLFFPTTIGSFLRIVFEFGTHALDSELIKSVSERSSNHYLGIALLERQIGQGTSLGVESASKRARLTTNQKLRASLQEWIGLASFYQDIDEPEMFEGLYRTHVASKELPKRAVNAKLSGDIALSCNLFQEAMDLHHEDTDPKEYDLWAKEGLRCFEQLTQWDDVSYNVTNDLSGNFGQLWNKEYMVPYMHYFLRSNVKLRKGILDENNNLIPWTSDNPNPLIPFMKDAIQSNDKLTYLIDNHATEISLAAIYEDDFDRARHYIRQSYDPLHITWVNLHPLSKPTRMKALSLLQKTVELEDFLEVVGEIQRAEVIDEKLNRYTRTLERWYPDPQLDGMELWDDIIDSRTVFLETLIELLKKHKTNYTLKPQLSEMRKTFLLEMISAARQQNNFNVAIDRWQRLLQLGNVEQYQRNYAYITIELQRSLATDDHSKQVQMAARTLGLVLNYKLPDDKLGVSNNFAIEFHMTAGQVMEVARNQLQTNTSAYQEFQANKAITKQMHKKQFKDKSEFISYLTLQGYNHLRTAYTMISDDMSTLEAECLWKFGDYCDNVLLSNETQSNETQVMINTAQYCQTVINNFFRAIHLGHRQAAERFPRLLELIERYPETGTDFKANAEKDSVVWRYIRWIPQLVAILDKPTAKYIYPIILKLAQEYPSALYYPFQLSNEHYECYKEQLDPTNRNMIARIKEIIRSPLMETFTNELRRLTNPEHIVKDFIDFIMSMGQRVDVNNTFLDDAYQQFSDLLLNPTDSRFGTIPKAFAVKHASQLREILGKDGSSIRSMSDKQKSKLLKYYQTNIQNQKIPGASDLLRSYSPWLANFQSTNYKEQIEIPGQYHGRSIPDPESHVKIANFDDRLLVMGSLRKPKRIRIYGTDGKDSMFLVKGGEDLRLDQRVQQLFAVMNELIQKESYCIRHDVHLTTYNVIPMSTNLGMIEWVQDTVPLRNCIDEQLNNKGLTVRVQENYRLFVSRHKGEVMGYHNLFKASRDSVVKNFEQLTGSFSDDILKQYLMRLAATPESFIFMRNNFAHSLAAICIAGYLLGIGDRHLENIMVDKKRGTLLAIDFGHAFGSATELLPVPEMVPFRLTRQLVGALEPLGIKGILEVAMVHALDAIQMEKQVLLNVMDVFVKEPLLDWKKAAAKQAKAQKRDGDNKSSNSSDFMAGSASSTGSSNEYQWYPQQKLETARKKLNSINPSVIVSEELERGHRGKSYLQGLQQVVKGVPGIDIRADVGEQCQDTLEQVQCLINLATDPNILGRTWVGWQPFFVVICLGNIN